MNRETLTAQGQVDVSVMRCLADMAQATAWLNFTAAQANHDMQRCGEWRCDYATQASIFQRDYENAGRELMELMQVTTAKTAIEITDPLCEALNSGDGSYRP